jgi:hypothetical protein
MKIRWAHCLSLASLASIAACATADDLNDGYFVSSVSLPQSCEALYGDDGCCSAAAKATKNAGAAGISCSEQKKVVQDAIKGGAAAEVYDSSCRRTLDSYRQAGYCKTDSTQGNGSAGSGGGRNTTNGSGGAGSSPDCDNTGDCSTCATCAGSSKCKAELNACNADSDCVDYVSCLNDCLTDDCAYACELDYPEGSDVYLSYASCVVCDYCPVDCDAVGSGC